MHRAIPELAAERPRTPRLESRLLFASALVRVGAFRCSVDHPLFAEAGEIHDHQFVFPRTSVWIRHEGSTAFAADPALVTLYNRDQQYSRAPIAADGDRSDWFSVADDVAREIAAAVDPVSQDDPDHPFRAAWVTSTPCLYLAQRQLFERLAGGEPVPALEVEETVISLLASVLGQPDCRDRMASTCSNARRARELAHAARAEIDRCFAESLSLPELASRLGSSPFALCRAFRSHCGTTQHAHLTRMRLFAALERLAASEADLTGLGLDLGFSSHSHFTMRFRTAFGVTPSKARDQLARGGGRLLKELAARVVTA